MCALLIFIVALVVTVVVIACVYSGSYYQPASYSVWTVLLWFFIIWFIAGIVLSGCSRRECKPKEEAIQLFQTGYSVNATADSPLNVQLTLDKWNRREAAILGVRLNGNEIPTCGGAPLPAEKPEGYSQIFNVVVPATMNEMSTPELLSWTSPNGTVLTVKWVSNFDNVFVSLTPVNDVKFIGNLTFGVLNNGTVYSHRQHQKLNWHVRDRDSD
jgi:hypothetical protein